MAKADLNGYIPLKSLDEIGNPIVERRLKLPDGRKFLVRMRALSDLEQREVRLGVAFPEQPIDMQRIEGRVQRVPATSGPAFTQYQERMEIATGKVARLSVVRALQVEIPGATEEDKAAYLERELPLGVQAALMNMLTRLQTISEEEIEEAKNG